MKLGKTYEPAHSEGDVYKLWEESGAFKPKNRGNDETYSIVMPPPNANANLHIGYELTAVLEDIPARYHRMKGKAVLLLPGADHAGFETQVVYEKHLAKQGKSRFDFSREELHQQIWDFVAANKVNFERQLRSMGASCDWSKFTFTLDQKIVERAYKTFKQMWDDKLIYRGERLVNFCTFHGTAFADIEVEYHTEQGKMYYIRFPLVPVDHVKDTKDYVLIATTRPETLLGDVAVAVNPEDKRYKHLVGRTIKIPLANREVPIIADTMVDTEFGTGAVKITAAHDPNDFDVAKKHNLPLLQVITEHGTIGHDAPREYHDLTVEEGRKKVVEDVEKLGLLEKIEDHEHRVGHCYKCKTVIQPLVRDQWFVDMKPLAKTAIDALKAKQISFYPEAKRDQLVRYLQGLRDWNISRQIAWGIPIPAFQNINDPDDWIFNTRVDQEEITVDDKTYRRDPDVFDTWFSSSSWPYATLDFPEGDDFKNFYPLSLMETGGEILQPWVSRMIMLGLYVTGKVPFESVYIHGYVMAEDGSKMSKSVGNVVDPTPVIEKYGSDALRMGIIAGRAPAVNRGYDTAKVEGARNFCNKLWNVARYIEGAIEEQTVSPNPTIRSVADSWILHQINQAIEGISNDLENYRFAEAYDKIYQLMWNDFADWYIEASKANPNTEMLLYGLQTILKLAHPFAPFATETIWQTMHGKDATLLITEAWPTVSESDKKAANEFGTVKKIVVETRALIKAIQPSDTTLYHDSDSFIDKHGALIKQLAKLKNVEAGKGSDASVRLTETGHSAWLNVEPDQLKAFLSKLNDSITQSEQTANKLQGRLSNKSYVTNAPAAVVEQTRQQLAQAQEQLAAMKAELARFA